MIGSFRIGLLTPSERKNMVSATIEGSLVVAAVQVLGSFAAVYVLRLGGTLYHVGYLTSVPFLINAMVLAVSAAFSVTARQALRLSLASAIAHRILMASIPLAPLFGLNAPWWVIGAYSLTSAALSLSSSYWTTAVSDMFSPKKRGRVFGIRGVFTGLAGFLATFLAGFLLDAFAFPTNFSITFWIATGIGAAGAYFLSRLEPPDDIELAPAASEKVPNEPAPAAESPSGLGRPPISAQGFGRSVVSVGVPLAVFNTGFFLLAPIINIYFIERLGLSNSAIGLLTSTFVLAQVLGSLVWGALTDRLGNQSVAFVTTAGMALQSAIYWVTPSILYLFLVQALGGFCLAGVMLGTFNMLIAAGDRKSRSKTITTVNIFANFAAFAGPLIGTAALVSIGFVPTFFVATALRAAATVMYFPGARIEFSRVPKRTRPRERRRIRPRIYWRHRRRRPSPPTSPTPLTPGRD